MMPQSIRATIARAGPRARACAPGRPRRDSRPRQPRRARRSASGRWRAVRIPFHPLGGPADRPGLIQRVAAQPRAGRRHGQSGDNGARRLSRGLPGDEHHRLRLGQRLHRRRARRARLDQRRRQLAIVVERGRPEQGRVFRRRERGACRQIVHEPVVRVPDQNPARWSRHAQALAGYVRLLRQEIERVVAEHRQKRPVL